MSFALVCCTSRVILERKSVERSLSSIAAAVESVPSAGWLRRKPNDFFTSSRILFRDATVNKWYSHALLMIEQG
jgi:hypothetical protein